MQIEKKNIAVLVSLMVAVGLNVYLRTFTINFPQFKSLAKEATEIEITKQAVKSVDKKFPGYSEFAKDSLISAFIEEYKKQNHEVIKSKVYERYLQLKDKYQDAKGQTYLLEIDPWSYMRYTENVIKKGHPGDFVRNGNQIDALVLAGGPSGTVICWDTFLYYSAAALYKVFTFVRPIPIETFVFYLPLFFTAIFIAVLFLFCLYRWGYVSALVTCFFVGFARIFLYRSCAGWFDTDILNLLFPILITWIYLKGICVTSMPVKAFWIICAGIIVGLFSLVWVGWWFIFCAILMYEVFTLLNLFFLKWQYKQVISVAFKEHLLSLLLFVACSIISVLCFSGITPLKELFLTYPKIVFVLNKSLSSSCWPNVYSTVEELQKMNFSFLLNSIGGPFLFILSFGAMMFIFLLSPRNQNYSCFERESIVIFVMWFTIMFFASLQGKRFSMFLLVPLGVSLGWIVRDGNNFLQKRQLGWKTRILMLIAVICLCLKMFLSGYKDALEIRPNMHDVFYKVLVKIKEAAPAGCILNSWWDYGDYFKSIAQRPVIFDGQSQNTPYAYWMAKVLVTSDEKKAIGILRMLNNGGNRAFEIVNEYLKDSFKSVLLIENTLALGQKEAKTKLLKLLPPVVTDEIIQLLFAKPKNAFFIVDPSMPRKMRSISFLGNWDFSKVYLAQSITSKDYKGKVVKYLEELGLDSQLIKRFTTEAELISSDNFDQWVTHKINSYDQWLNGREDNGLVFFDGGIIYVPKEERVYLQDEDGYKVPKSLFLLKDEKLQEIPLVNQNTDSSVLIHKMDNKWYALIVESDFAKSMFARLYYLGGKGLVHFKPFIEEADQGGYIRVFEINWD